MKVKEEFIKRFGRQAYLVGLATDFPPEILLAQSALETGWGRHIHANNLFGLKDLAFDPGSSEAETFEAENNQKKKIKALFEDFDSPIESMLAYVALIRLFPRYHKAWLLRKDPRKYFKALQEAGYATDPEYAKKCLAVLKSLPTDWLEIALGR